MTAVPTETLTADEIVKLAREQVDAFNKGDWERVRAGLAPDCRYDEFGTQRKVEGSEKIVELFKGWKQAFPDAVGTVTSAVASGDKAALEVTWKGTHTGPLATAEGTIPASGKRQETPAAYLLHLRGRQDQGESPLLRLDDSPQADRRAAQVAGGAYPEGATRRSPPPTFLRLVQQLDGDRSLDLVVRRRGRDRRRLTQNNSGRPRSRSAADGNRHPEGSARPNHVGCVRPPVRRTLKPVGRDCGNGQTRNCFCAVCCHDGAARSRVRIWRRAGCDPELPGRFSASAYVRACWLLRWRHSVRRSQREPADLHQVLEHAERHRVHGRRGAEEVAALPPRCSHEPSPRFSSARALALDRRGHPPTAARSGAPLLPRHLRVGR